MSDSEDDYMSDKLLQNVEKDIRPGLVLNRTTKRKYDLEKQKKEVEAKRPKNSKEREEQLRQAGLNTAISTENKGFKLLAKMGFKEGEGLGKTRSGITEPIGIQLKSGKSGVGLENHFKERVTRNIETRKNGLAQTMNDFRQSNKMKQAMRFLQKDFVTAQRACEDLDNRKEISEPTMEFFWTRETMKKRKCIEDEEEEEIFNEEFNLFFTEDNLTEIIDHLRCTHLYCMYCAFVATDENDLNTNCPGPYRNDHDDG